MLKMANTYPEVEDIKQDLKSLKTHAGELTEHVKAEGRAKVERMASRANEEMHHLKDRANEEMHHMKDVGREKLRTMESYVQENPVQSLVYAFLGGLAASFLLGRR